MVNVTFSQAKAILDDEPKAVILDVREEEEYITGHARNALLLPVDELDEVRAAEELPDKNIPVLTYCRTGQRSAVAAKMLEDYGYTRVYNIGSLIGWPYGLE